MLETILPRIDGIDFSLNYFSSSFLVRMHFIIHGSWITVKRKCQWPRVDRIFPTSVYLASVGIEMALLHPDWFIDLAVYTCLIKTLLSHYTVCTCLSQCVCFFAINFFCIFLLFYSFIKLG